MNYEGLTIDEMAEVLMEEFGVSDETIEVVANINGWSEKTMENILYAVSGYNSFDQLND